MKKTDDDIKAKTANIAKWTKEKEDDPSKLATNDKLIANA